MLLPLRTLALLGAMVVAGLAGSFPGTAAAAGSKLTEADVKDVIEHSIRPSIHARFIWRSVQIAPPRKASAWEQANLGIPPKAAVYPVRVDYTQVIGDSGRDYKWNYFYYQDDFGTWAKQSNATTGNLGSDAYYVKPEKK